MNKIIILIMFIPLTFSSCSNFKYLTFIRKQYKIYYNKQLYYFISY